MTCIVGIVHDGQVWLGGDSAGVDQGHYLLRTVHPKVFRNGAYLIGYTTSFRMGQLIEFADLPEPPETGLYRFMVGAFVDAVRKALSDGGWLKTENGRECGGSFLVGVRGHLFMVEDWFNVMEVLDGFHVAGSGISVARGSLWSSRGKAPEVRVREALEASERFTTDVCGPFHIITGDWAGPRGV